MVAEKTAKTLGGYFFAASCTQIPHMATTMLPHVASCLIN